MDKSPEKRSPSWPWKFVVGTIIGLGTIAATMSAWHWGTPETRITASISFEKERMPPEVEDRLGGEFFQKPHLRAWVYVHLKNSTETTAHAVSVTVPDTTVYSVPEVNSLSSHVTRGSDTYKIGDLAPGETARAVFFTEDLPKWENLRLISVYQEGAKPVQRYSGPSGVVPVPFFHKQSVLIFGTSLVWILGLCAYAFVKRIGRESRTIIQS